jgi:hypothetical protein
MAKATEKSSKGRSLSKKHVEAAALAAANEAMEEIDTEDLEDDEEEGFESPLSLPKPSTLDVFEEGFAKAQALNDVPRYHIKKNSQMIAFRDYPYSWERLQQEFGPGMYQIFAKRRSNGQLLKQQMEMIGDPNEGREIEPEESPKSADAAFNMMALFTSQQERAETRAREESTKAENNMATIMQTMMQAQQSNQQLMMTMMAENSKSMMAILAPLLAGNQNKGPDPMMTLVTTLLTKEKPKEGMPIGEVLKMLADRERDTRQAMEKQYEAIEKKSDALAVIKAEAMSSGDGDDEPKSLLGTLVPVMAQIIQQHQQGQNALTPEQQLQLRIQQERQLAGNGSIDEDFVDSSRPAIRAPAHIQATRQRQAQPTPQNRPRQAAPAPTVVQNPVPKPQPPQVVVLNDRQKESVLEFVGMDIATAMMTGAPASKTAEEVMKKLENEGVARQTIGNSFTLEDFYKYADKYVPTESLEPAKVWLKEFHESFPKQVAQPQAAGPIAQGEKPARPIGTTVSKPSTTVESANGHLNGSGKAQTVARGGNKPPASGTGTPSREPSTDIGN